VDVCSFSLLEDPQLKQALLCDADVARRVRAAVIAISNHLPPTRPSASFAEPSVN
jgi:hypothetical protein